MSDPSVVGAADPVADPKKIADPASTVSRADPLGVGDEAQANIADAPSGDVNDPPKLEQLSRGDAQQTQFPSLHGQAGVEIAERSADVTKLATKRHRKIFRVFHGGLGLGDGFDHGPNFRATRQYMVDHGLRPVGDVTFSGAEPYDDKNTDLVYEVEALPAAIATEPDTAHVVISQE